MDSLIDGEDPRCVPWAQRRAYPLTSLWFGISFHDHVPTPAPMRLAGRGVGPYEVGCTALPDWEGTDVLGCCVIDVSAKAPLTLSGGATLLVRHEVRRRPDDHVAAAMACITSLVECTRGWNH